MAEWNDDDDDDIDGDIVDGGMLVVSTTSMMDEWNYNDDGIFMMVVLLSNVSWLDRFSVSLRTLVLFTPCLCVRIAMQVVPGAFPFREGRDSGAMDMITLTTALTFQPT